MRDATRQTIADVILAALVAAGAALLFIGAAELPPPRFEPLGSAALPRILGTLLIFFAVILVIRALLRLRAGQASAAAPSGADPRRGALVFVALVLYVAALDFGRMPFVPATTVFVTATGLVIGARSWVNLAVFAAVGLVLSLAISTILERFLYISIG
ncbi:MAG: tripartite tricarboxylate transporter TctB family protein [Marinovum algicola]|uniref:Tripartite tricarboxylate transporter TctB family protein n=1 Tax=Marinovum algicola TaxID=42444 RepID=A0A975W6L7_9RHOB|nr:MULTISPECIES: tripartite tricarboxylate transporter TctB family protein [Marinovum]MDD9740996.1 tripartite tricarboxylate transporter TctB family protein [Marinovum sp. SP66]SEI61444.1 Tripartite tricarboxylate transporter TctB family protein [Marinovum algicola]SLN26048.1 Tripartite tricarboxylate transporter TctB family protein [Marinovum algicola]